MKIPGIGTVRSALARSVLAGLLAALLALLVGAGYIATRERPYEADATLLVLPKTVSGQPDTVAGLYDTLSQGQVSATFAELLRNRLSVAGLAPGGTTTGQQTGLSLSVQVVPDTSVLRIAVTGSDAALAEAVAVNGSRQARTVLAGLQGPYRAVVISDGRSSAIPVGTSRLLRVAVVLLVAALVGLAVQQVAAQFYQLARRPAGVPTGPAPAAVPLARPTERVPQPEVPTAAPTTPLVPSPWPRTEAQRRAT